MTNTKKQDVVWRSYSEYPFIEANQYGEIRIKDRHVTCKDGSKRLYKGRVLKQRENRNGYISVFFGVNGKAVGRLVHRIVATCFLPNPDNLPEVNHKDNNPKNNSASNLEWCTPQYNTAYREKYGVSAAEALGRPVFAVNLKTSEVLRFESQHEAGRQLGVDFRNINGVLKGRKKQIGGFWFTEDESEITAGKIQKIKDGMTKGVFAVNLKMTKVSFFESQTEAAQQLNIFNQNINSVLKDRLKQTHGYWFCYADSNAIENIRAKFGDEVASQLN